MLLLNLMLHLWIYADTDFNTSYVVIKLDFECLRNLVDA